MQSKVGTILDGKYEILKQIGKGGMSIVYLAMDRRLNKQWAVKEIAKRSDKNIDEIVINSLLIEANLMKKLDHPSLPRIVDIIEEEDTIYIVMDYIEGESLDKIVKEYGPQPQDLVIEWALQLCDTLRYLHSQNPPIIYRDMKPGNIMIKPDGNIKVIDFGIAREYKEDGLSDTKVLGTKGYAPPEQHGLRQTDARSDIYSLGMTIQNLLTGEDPRRPDYEYKPLRTYDSDFSGGLERIIEKCIELNPDDRYQNCEDLMYALYNYEKEDVNYQIKQKKKLNIFIGTSIMTVIFLLGGLFSMYMSRLELNRDYDSKINISESTPYKEKISSYIEAIEINPNKQDAYLKLISAYVDSGVFGDEQSSQLNTILNGKAHNLDKNDEKTLKLYYETATMYLYLYTGSDDSFRARILKSRPYFETIVKSENKDFEYYDISYNYNIIGDFYSKYIINSTSIKEPKLEDYEELLSSLKVCIQNLREYEAEDAPYIKLTTYSEIQNLLNNHRNGMAKVGIDKSKILDILKDISNNTQRTQVTQQKSINIKNDIEKNNLAILENLRNAYLR
ncbi:MAG: serine/threonine-protein kinase [Tissierellia bacterium]|nr:serine/threonine-protein kinase [Tissierellia bacterium]